MTTTKGSATAATAKTEHHNVTKDGGVPAAQRQAMETLPADHNYRDRVEAQAKSLNITIDPSWTLERLLFEIRMQASS